MQLQLLGEMGGVQPLVAPEPDRASVRLVLLLRYDMTAFASFSAILSGLR